MKHVGSSANAADIATKGQLGGAASGLTNATGIVTVSASAAPVSGQVLVATSPTTAAWQDVPAPGFDQHFLLMGM